MTRAAGTCCQSVTTPSKYESVSRISAHLGARGDRRRGEQRERERGRQDGSPRKGAQDRMRRVLGRMATSVLFGCSRSRHTQRFRPGQERLRPRVLSRSAFGNSDFGWAGTGLAGPPDANRCGMWAGSDDRPQSRSSAGPRPRACPSGSAASSRSLGRALRSRRRCDRTARFAGARSPRRSCGLVLGHAPI